MLGLTFSNWYAVVCALANAFAMKSSPLGGLDEVPFALRPAWVCCLFACQLRCFRPRVGCLNASGSARSIAPQLFIRDGWPPWSVRELKFVNPFKPIFQWAGNVEIILGFDWKLKRFHHYMRS